MLVALPAELLIQILALLSMAADFARAARSCTAMRNALEQAARASVLGRGLPSSEARPWLQLSPFKRIRLPWSFLLRAAEVRPHVLEALGPAPPFEVHKWFYGKHDAPTRWCIANEQTIRDEQERAAREEAMREQQAAARAAKEECRRIRDQAARERMRARMAAHRLSKVSVSSKGGSKETVSSEDDDW